MTERRAAQSAAGARPVVLGLAVAAAVAVGLVGRWLLTRPSEAPVVSGPRMKIPPPPGETPHAKTKAKAAPTTGSAAQSVVPEAFKDALFYDDFSASDLFASGRWIATRDGDFKEAATDTVDGRLRIRLGTIGTRDDTVKHLGIRSANAVVDFSTPIEVALEIDWNNQANGCYLQASLFLCPTSTDDTAASEKDWLKFEYVGVPPGRNARAALWRRKGCNLRFLYDEGWPHEQKTGRPIGRQRVALRLDRENVQIIENGKVLWGPEPHGCDFTRAFLYIEACSHSNYPPRELFFDNVVVRPAPKPQQ